MTAELTIQAFNKANKSSDIYQVCRRKDTIVNWDSIVWNTNAPLR